MRLSISRFFTRFTWPHWSMSLIAVLVIGLFLKLGFWQLHRANEKKHILLAEQAEAARLPALWFGDDDEIVPFKRVAFAGKFLPKVFFLDNQYHAHQIGYHVISPLLLASGRVVLLDRGWVPAHANRADLPDVTIPNEILDLSGTVYLPSGKTWLLGSKIESQRDHRVVIEAIDFEWMSQFLHKSVYPFIIRLDKTSPAGYVRDWVTVVMPPARHYGYAFQWFALACVAFVVFVALNRRKNK